MGKALRTMVFPHGQVVNLVPKRIAGFVLAAQFVKEASENPHLQDFSILALGFREFDPSGLDGLEIFDSGHTPGMKDCWFEVALAPVLGSSESFAAISKILLRGPS